MLCFTASPPLTVLSVITYLTPTSASKRTTPKTSSTTDLNPRLQCSLSAPPIGRRTRIEVSGDDEAGRTVTPAGSSNRRVQQQDGGQRHQCGKCSCRRPMTPMRWEETARSGLLTELESQEFGGFS